MRIDQRVFITVLGGRFGFNGHTGKFFNQVFSNHSSVVGGAAGHNLDTVDAFHGFGIKVDVVQHDFIREAASGQGVGHRLWLFVDFLKHKVVVAALFGVARVPVHVKDLLAGFTAGFVQYGDAVPGQDGDLVIIQQINLAGIFQDGRNVGGDVVFAFAETHDERAVLADGNHAVGFLAAENAQRVGAFDLVNGQAQRLNHVPGVQGIEQMGNDFGIGIGHEKVSFLDQLFLELDIIFNDPIVDDRDAVVDAAMGMGVDIRRFAVGGPAGMADAGCAGQGFFFKLGL